MTRLIDADSVYKWYLEAFKGLIKPNEIRFSINDIRDNLENIPTVDAVPAKRGKWLWVDGVRCSQCNYKLQTTGLPSYCPHCGADMRGEENYRQR